MSLDVDLYGEPYEEECACPECDNKHTRTVKPCYYSANITHNLNAMARAAGIYDCVWRPDENGITHARQIIKPLEAGIALMVSDPARFKQYDAANGWGTYDEFIPWLERYLDACMEYPDAEVKVSR